MNHCPLTEGDKDAGEGPLTDETSRKRLLKILTGNIYSHRAIATVNCGPSSHQGCPEQTTTHRDVSARL